jgi:hypothetical protein
MAVGCHYWRTIFWSHPKLNILAAEWNLVVMGGFEWGKRISGMSNDEVKSDGYMGAGRVVVSLEVVSNERLSSADQGASREPPGSSYLRVEGRMRVVV